MRSSNDRESASAWAISLALLIVVALLGYRVWNQREQLERLDHALHVSERAMQRLADNNFEHPRFEHRDLDELRIVERPATDSEDVFAVSRMRDASIESYADFSAFAESRYRTSRAWIAETWGLEQGSPARAFFFLNLVSHMWGYGNPSPEHSAKPGCVAQNETTDFRRIDTPTIRTYIESEIGCSGDHAELLSFLLSSATVENRIVTVDEHHFVEALIESSWHILDATLNLAVEGTWQELLDRKRGTPQSVRVTLFPHHNMTDPSNPHYRPRMGAYRIAWLISLAKSGGREAIVRPGSR